MSDDRQSQSSLNSQAINKDALTRSAGRSALWQTLGGAWQTAVRLAASIVLARVLNPSDFGIMGMALLVHTFIERIGTLSMGPGIIAKKDITENDLNTCFWTMTGVRLCLFAIAIALAPLAAAIFNEPKLVWVVRAVSLSFLLVLIGSVSMMLLSKEIRFGPLVVIRSIGVLIESGTAVALVLFTDLKYWALVLSMLIATLFIQISMFLVVRWYPKLKFSFESFRYLFRYGINGLGYSVTTYLHENIDYLLVAKILGTSTLGLYEFAYRIPHVIFERFAMPASGVVLPALSKLQTDDSLLISGFLKSTKYIAYIVFPLMGGLAVLAEPTVLVLWGSKWLAIVFPLKILCLSSAIRCTFHSTGAVFQCKNRPDIPFKFGLLRFIFTFAIVIALGRLYGLNGVAIGMALSTVPDFFLVRVAFRMTRIPLYYFVSNLLSPVVVSGISVLGAYIIYRTMNNILDNQAINLIISIVAGALSYFLSFLMIFPLEVEKIVETLRIVMGREVGAGGISESKLMREIV